MDEFVEIFVVVVLIGLPVSIFVPTYFENRNQKAEENPAHVCLFKRDVKGRVHSFHEARFDPNIGAIAEQYGRIGTEGKRVNHNRNLRIDDLEHIEQILAPARADGYEELLPGELKNFKAVVTFTRAERGEFIDIIGDLHDKLYWTHMGSAKRGRRIGNSGDLDGEINWMGSDWENTAPIKIGQQHLTLQTFDEEFARNALIELLEKSSKKARLGNYKITKFDLVTHPTPD